MYLCDSEEDYKKESEIKVQLKISKKSDFP